MHLLHYERQPMLWGQPRLRTKRCNSTQARTTTMKKILFGLTAIAIAATTLSAPASAGTTGCDQGGPNASVKATNCAD
jgi:hypothetical protein